MKRLYGITLILSLFILLLSSCTSKNVKIACVGDSITAGYGLPYQSHNSYPARLDSILGPGYSVMDFGRSATTLRKHGDFPYWTCKEFYNVFAYKPNIIIIQLGTNDTKTQNWDSTSFAQDYQALIDTFQTIQTKPKIYLCLPVPVFHTRWTINDSTLTKWVNPIIKNLAKKNHLPVINLHKQMKPYGKYFQADSVHPNVKGARIMAGFVAKDLKKILNK